MTESPFAKQNHGFEREKTTCESVKDLITDGARDAFIELLPSEELKELPSQIMYPMGTTVFILLTGAFLAIFISGYQSTIDTEYLSPLDGNSPSKYCETISLANTGTYLATQSGLWEGSTLFQYSEAAYSVTVTSFTASYESYAKYMNDVYDNFNTIGQQSLTQDLGKNLLYWMSQSYTADSSAQRFSLVGTPLVIFDRQKTYGTLSNINGVCNATSHASFNSANGNLELIYDYNEFMANPSCADIVDPTLLGYDAGVDNEFTVKVDIRTLITGVAVNSQIIELADLVIIDDMSLNYTFNEVTYSVSSYYDAQYAGMDPITCISNANLPAQCILTVSGILYASPIYNHAGSNTSWPERCNCNTLTTEELMDAKNNCNLFSFLSGFIFWNTNLPDYVIQQCINYNYNLAQVNDDALNASFIGSYWGRVSHLSSQLNTPAYRTESYQFCNVSGVTCALLTFSSFDNNPINWAVSDYYYQILYGACRNTIAPSAESWQQLIDQPFAPLIQQYQKCKNDPTTVFLNQVGVSMGNLSIVTPFCVMIVFWLLYLYQSTCHVVIKRQYSANEKDRALNALAISLLLARDERMKQAKNRNDLESILKKLVLELEETAETSDFHYDEKSEQVGVDWKALGNAVVKKVTGGNRSGGGGKRGKQGSNRGAAGGGDDGVRGGANPMHHYHSSIEGGGGGGGDVSFSGGDIELQATTGISSSSSSSSSAAHHHHHAASLSLSNVIILNNYSATAAAGGAGSSTVTAAGKNLEELSRFVDSSSSSRLVGEHREHRLLVDKFLEFLQENISKLEQLRSDSADGATSNPLYWVVTSHLVELQNESLAHALDSANERTAVYELLEKLLLTHCALYLSIGKEEIELNYSSKLAYRVGKEVMTLKMLRSMTKRK